MGNNNATANLTEEESSKLQTNGMSPLDSVSVETTQNHVFLAGKGKYEDREKENFPDGNVGKGTPETEPQSKELVEDPKVKNVEEEMHQSDLESLVMENDKKLHQKTSVAEGVEAVCEATEVEELPMIGTQSVESKLNTTESGNEERPCVVDEIVSVSPSFYETDGTEEKMINESLGEIVPAEEDFKLDQEEICMEQRIGFPKFEPQEILNLEYRAVDDDEVTNEGKVNQAITEPGSQESNDVQETGLGAYKEERDKETGREASLKRMSRCRSVPVSHKSRVMGDFQVQQLVSEVSLASRNKMDLGKAKRTETLQETTEAMTESNKEAGLELRSPSFGNDLRIKERSDKIETYEEPIAVEEKTVMLKRTETEKTRGFELSLGLSMKPSRRSEGDDSFKETKGSGDNLLDKKAKTSETLLVPCVESNEAEVTTETITESNKEALLEMRSPSFGNDLRIKERSDESTEKVPLLCQDKTETYEATIDVEKKTVMLKRSETEKTRGFELSLGLSMKPGERSEPDDSSKETKGSSGDNLLDKNASLGSMKGRVRKRSKSSVFGTCLCCVTAMN